TQWGQQFGMPMHFEQTGNDYHMWNTVTVLEPSRAIAWAPGYHDDNGDLAMGGHVWRYALQPEGQSTRVSLTYDWTDMPQALRDGIGGMPPFDAEFLHESLAALDRSVS